VTTISTRELCDLAHVTYRQADYWIRRGYLICENPEAGSGVPRRHDLGEVRVAQGLRQLLLAGCTEGDEVARTLRSLPDDREGAVLIDAQGYSTLNIDRAVWVVHVEPALAPA
jgi:hypothetical protein